MRRIFPLILAVVALAAMPVDAQQRGAFPVWLAGTWAMQDGAAWGDEVWTAARGGQMLGLGRLGFANDVESWETKRIVRKADGSLSLYVQLKGGAAIEYAASAAGEGVIEFANPALNPQRLGFSREGQLLMVETSRLDGSELVRRNYRPVETAPKD